MEQAIEIWQTLQIFALNVKVPGGAIRWYRTTKEGKETEFAAQGRPSETGETETGTRRFGE